MEVKKMLQNRLAITGIIFVLVGILSCFLCIPLISKNDLIHAKSNTHYTFKKDDVDWTIEDSIVNGERELVFNYKNNSKVTIAQVDLELTPKSDTTLDSLQAAFPDYYEDEDVDEDELDDFYLTASNRKVAKPGKTVKNGWVVIGNMNWPVTSMDQYNLVEPDALTITYVYKNKLRVAYYDCKNEKYSYDDTSKDAYEWSNSKMARKLPKPDYTIVQVTSDDKDDFSFSAYGVREKDFNKYIKSCKQKGFTENQDNEYEDHYKADNKNGYSVEISYDSNEETMNVTLEEE